MFTLRGWLLTVAGGLLAAYYTGNIQLDAAAMRVGLPLVALLFLFVESAPRESRGGRRRTGHGGRARYYTRPPQWRRARRLVRRAAGERRLSGRRQAPVAAVGDDLLPQSTLLSGGGPDHPGRHACAPTTDLERGSVSVLRASLLTLGPAHRRRSGGQPDRCSTRGRATSGTRSSSGTSRGCEKCGGFRLRTEQSSQRGWYYVGEPTAGGVRSGNRLEVIHSTPVEQPRHLDRVFHGVHHHLGLTIGHHGDDVEPVPAPAIEGATSRPPWPFYCG